MRNTGGMKWDIVLKWGLVQLQSRDKCGVDFVIPVEGDYVSSTQQIAALIGKYRGSTCGVLRCVKRSFFFVPAVTFPPPNPLCMKVDHIQNRDEQELPDLSTVPKHVSLSFLSFPLSAKGCPKVTWHSKRCEATRRGCRS